MKILLRRPRVGQARNPRQEPVLRDLASMERQWSKL